MSEPYFHTIMYHTTVSVPYRCAIDSNGNFGLAARYFDGKGLGLTLLQPQVIPSVLPIYQLTSIS